MTQKLRVGILGATGMVGQRFITLLKDHPWFEVTTVAASPKSAGLSYAEAVAGRWLMSEAIPENVRAIKVYSAENDVAKIVGEVDFVFSALDMTKEKICVLEEACAEKNVPVVSNNSAHRWTVDVPMIMPEINPEHLAAIDIQRQRRGWDRGFIVTKHNCSLQSYVPAIQPLKKFGVEKVAVTTLQALSGAGKTLEIWPEMSDNVIPFIGGEEEKTEREPLKIWGRVGSDGIVSASGPPISATCIRVPVSDGHMAAVTVSLQEKVSKEQIIDAWRGYVNPIAQDNLPSAPVPLITYLEEDNRPQTRLDRLVGKGMGITVGRLRPDAILNWKFIALAHNTIRGAAGGAILTAELLKARGYM